MLMLAAEPTSGILDVFASEYATPPTIGGAVHQTAIPYASASPPAVFFPPPISMTLPGYRTGTMAPTAGTFPWGLVLTLGAIAAGIWWVTKRS
jgi:hypothetical protein